MFTEYRDLAIVPVRELMANSGVRQLFSSLLNWGIEPPKPGTSLHPLLEYIKLQKMGETDHGSILSKVIETLYKPQHYRSLTGVTMVIETDVKLCLFNCLWLLYLICFWLYKSIRPHHDFINIIRCVLTVTMNGVATSRQLYTGQQNKKNILVSRILELILAIFGALNLNMKSVFLYQLYFLRFVFFKLSKLFRFLDFGRWL